ncbi:hypothetical protein NKR74_14940 [Bacillus sp. 3103sda1]|nr:hypothetical protein [Bacillus sp. 3103sda1]MCP1124585.1 hypothetical protein [Bacillus sp. 3103sda1]
MRVIPWDKRIYALYQGDQFITEGTILEISAGTNRTLSYLRYLLTPSYAKKCGNSTSRIRLFQLDEGDEE